MLNLSTGRDRAARPEGSDTPAAPGAPALAATLALLLSATTVVLATVDSRPGDDYQVHTLLLVSDLALLACAVASSRSAAAALRSWRRHACGLAGVVLGVSMVPALLVNPSDRGVAALARLAGAAALALSIGSVRGEARRMVVGALGAVTLAHLAVALGERANDGPVGLGALGEPTAYEIGGRFASTGLTVHPYVLAAWAAVAGTVLLALVRRRLAPGRLASVAGGAAFAGIGLTMSRSGIVAGVLGLGALAVSALGRAPRSWRLTVLAAAAALVLGVLLDLSGWSTRAGQDTGSIDAISSGRGALMRQAWSLLGDQPLTGVGPGRYVLALDERPDLVVLSDQSPRPVHLTPLLLVVEGGLVVVPALALLAVAVGRACRRGGVPAVAVALAMLPFLALDHLVWSYPQGIVLAGIWLGALDLLGQRGEGVDDGGDGMEDPAC